MEFITSTYWQRGENTSALLLEQCRCKTTPILFACLCVEEAGERTRDGAGGVQLAQTEKSRGLAQVNTAGAAADYLTERLRAWFRGGDFIKAVARTEKYLERQRRDLASLVRRTDAELVEAGLIGQDVEVSLAGILCIGRDCILFGRGSAQIHLLNRNLGRPCTGIPISWGNEFCVNRGVMEPDIGLLLATDDFAANVGGQPLREGLFVEEVRTERQAKGHLQEIARLAEEAGGENMAAVLCFGLGEELL